MVKLNSRIASWIAQGLYFIIVLWPFVKAMAEADSPRGAALTAAPLGLLAVGVIVGMTWALVGEKRLTGGALVLGRAGLAAFGLLLVLAAMPLALDVQYGLTAASYDRALFGLMLWAIFAVPAAGVLVAYRMIGDGRPKPASVE